MSIVYFTIFPEYQDAGRGATHLLRTLLFPVRFIELFGVIIVQYSLLCET